MNEYADSLFIRIAQYNTYLKPDSGTTSFKERFNTNVWTQQTISVST